MTEGDRKNALFHRVDDSKLPISDSKYLPLGLMQLVNETLGNDNKSRLNLVLARRPSSHVEQLSVERISPVERGLIP
jgi:hypothetical protein